MTARSLDLALERVDREVLRQHQWERFSSLARRLWPTNGFYRRKWLGAGFGGPGDLKTWDDFTRLPFTTKGELVQDQTAYPPFGTNLTYPLSAYVRQHQTSGTTGAPLRWLDTAENWEWWQRIWCQIYAGAGVGPEDRIIFPFSFGPFVGFWSAYAGARRLGALVVTAGGQDTATRLQVIQEVQPTVLVGTPSYALHLAEVAAEHGIDLAGSSVRVTIHAGEPGANIPATKQRLQDLWGARAYDHYGLTEVGAAGFECLAQDGTHLIENEYIAEVIDPETCQLVAEGEVGELVLTNLGRTGMPLVRYRTRDLVRLTTEPCSCDRTLARMVGGVIGRSDDMMTVRGINVFPSAIENIVREFPTVAEFQLELYKDGAMNELRVRIEPAPGTPEAELVERLAAALRARLAIRIGVVVAAPGTLPRYAMKARRLIRM